MDALQYFAYVAETGKFVEALVNAPAGKNVLGYHGRKSFADIASIVSYLTGVPSTIVPMTVEQMAGSIPGVGKIFGTVGRAFRIFQSSSVPELSNLKFQVHFGQNSAKKLVVSCCLRQR